MTGSELRRLLKKAGARFEDGTRHIGINLNGKTSVMPRHPSKEIKSGLLNRILNDLGITLAELRGGRR